MTEFQRSSPHYEHPDDIGEDPVVCELMHAALQLQDSLLCGAGDAIIKREVDRHNALFAAFLGKRAVVRGDVYLPHVDDTASVWEQGLTLTYNGLSLTSHLDERGVESQVSHTFTHVTYDDEDQVRLVQAYAPTNSIVEFPEVASSEFLEKIYNTHLSRDTEDDDSIATQIDDVLVTHCDDVAEIFRQLSEINYESLTTLGVKALHAASDHLTTRLESSLAPFYLNATPVLCEFNDSYQVIATEDDCLFIPEHFEFLASRDQDEAKIPILALAGTVTSRAANIRNHPVHLPLQDIDVERFIDTPSSGSSER